MACMDNAPDEELITSGGVMSIIKRSPEFDLTDDEIGVLRGSGVDDGVRHYLARQHDNIGLRISAYRKVAAAARAEREAIVEVNLLAMARKESADTVTLQRQKAELENQNLTLVQQNEDLRRDLVRSIATPALAVHSED